MRPRFLISLIIVVLAILVIAFWLRPVQRIVITKPSQESVQQTNSVSSAVVSNTSQNVSNNSQPIASFPADSRPITTSFQERQMKVIQQANEKNSQPIEFYGKIIDQDGNPVSGVKINVSIQQTLASAPTASGDIPLNSNIHRFEKETDIDGRFEISGERGEGVNIDSIQKEGYQLSPSASESYGVSSGSFESPVIIRMWKNGTKEPLISGSRVFGIDSGKIYTLDLITGKKIEGEADGDLRVLITRPADAKPRVNFPWSFSIEVIGGGFVEANPDDEFMYLAPESGYEPKIEMQFDPNDLNWIGVINKRFFIRSRNGHVYGRVQVEVDAIYNVHSAIQINYAINPNGSRNLQP